MWPRCPVCELPYYREPGYYLGAMYFGYGIGAVVLGLLLLVARLIWPGLELHLLLLLAMVAFLPFLTIVFRYSRICWLHFDQVFDPKPPPP
jgi:uncharacterized protein (DUF983 family)